MSLNDGDTVTLVLRPGAHPDTHPDVALRGQAIERTVTGKVRRFEQDGLTRWEIATGDPAHPAIGFDPLTAELKTT